MEICNMADLAQAFRDYELGSDGIGHAIASVINDPANQAAGVPVIAPKQAQRITASMNRDDKNSLPRKFMRIFGNSNWWLNP